MTLEEQVGATLAVGFPDTEPTRELVEALRQTRAQSLVVFERNFASPEQFLRLIRALDHALGRRLFVMVDHEGGRVIRYRTGVTRFPSSLEVGRGRPDDAEQQGLTEARELRALNTHVNLTPCVDVLQPGCDPVIGDRSYGEDPACVAAFGAARIRGLQEGGVAACAKHYPGLGAVGRDPHKRLPTIDLDEAAMRRTHLPPFAAAVKAGVAMVMSSHVCYPRLGDPPGLPATFSPRLIQGWLREELRFPGLILSDDLEMGALRAFGSLGEAAVRAAEAGHDVLLMCSRTEQWQDACSTLVGAYRSGRLSLQALAASAERVAVAREKFLPATLPPG